MEVRFLICDVFTDTRFGGNQLAVLPDATGLTSEQMQKITREFNFSETTFVLPAEQGQTRRVRIFAPDTELPFAGHPNVGTAFVLASLGEFGPLGDATTVTFEEGAGLVPITVRATDGQPTSCELTAPQEIQLGKSYDPAAVAASVSLEADDVVTTVHPPQLASVGMPLLITELAGREALERARVDPAAADALSEELPEFLVHLYVRSDDDFDLRSRVFAPYEDPATGAANCALAGLLAHYDARETADFGWRIAQGVEMGRPSVLDARAVKRSGIVESTHIGGSVVLVAEGTLRLG